MHLKAAIRVSSSKVLYDVKKFNFFLLKLSVKMIQNAKKLN